jgi:hypothetical protein
MAGPVLRALVVGRTASVTLTCPVPRAFSGAVTLAVACLQILGPGAGLSHGAGLGLGTVLHLNPDLLAFLKHGRFREVAYLDPLAILGLGHHGIAGRRVADILHMDLGTHPVLRRLDPFGSFGRIMHPQPLAELGLDRRSLVGVIDNGLGDGCGAAYCE